MQKLAQLKCEQQFLEMLEVKPAPTISLKSKQLAQHTRPIHERYQQIKDLRQRNLEVLVLKHQKPDTDSLELQKQPHKSPERPEALLA